MYICNRFIYILFNVVPSTDRKFGKKVFYIIKITKSYNISSVPIFHYL